MFICVSLGMVAPVLSSCDGAGGGPGSEDPTRRQSAPKRRSTMRVFCRREGQAYRVMPVGCGAHQVPRSGPESGSGDARIVGSTWERKPTNFTAPMVASLTERSTAAFAGASTDAGAVWQRGASLSSLAPSDTGRRPDRIARFLPRVGYMVGPRVAIPVTQLVPSRGVLVPA